MSIRARLILSVVGLLLLGGFVFIPTRHERIISLGTDRYETHYALYGARVREQSISLPNDIVGVGAIVVNLRHAENLPQIHIRVSAEDGQELAVAMLDGRDISDDTFTWGNLPRRIEREKSPVTIAFSAPNGTNENAIGLRFDEKTNDIAMGVIERVSLWKQVVFWAKEDPRHAGTVGKTSLIALIVCMFLGVVGEKATGNRRWFVVGLAIVALVAIAIRIPTAVRVESTLGGDTFNFLLKGSAWLAGADPFSTDARKAPLLPLLLFPAHAGLIDPLVLGRVIGIGSAAAVVVLCMLILDRLRMPRGFTLGAGLLLAVNRELWWESLHGLSNVPFAALVAATMLAYVYTTSSRGKYLLGVLVGLATLMRYEGALVAGVLIPSVWVQDRFRLRTLIRAGGPCLLLILILFSMWPISGSLGVRTPGDIVDDPGLYLAWSIDDYLSNIDRLRLFLGRLWVLVPAVGSQWISVAAGAAMGVAWHVFSSKSARGSRYGKATLPYIFALLCAGLVFWNHAEWWKWYALAMSGIAGWGLAVSLIRWPRFMIPISVVMIAQILVITAILPKTRYYVHGIAWIVMGIAIAIWSWSASSTARQRIGGYLLFGALIGITYSDGIMSLGGQISDYNAQSASMTVMTRAAMFLQKHDGRIAVGDENLPLRVYAGDSRLVGYPGSRSTDVKAVTDWIHQEDVRYVVESSSHPLFSSSLELKPEIVRDVYEFTSRFGSERAFVYELDGF